MNPETLKPGQIHLWFTFPAEIQAPNLLSAYRQLMNAEEKAQQQRLRFERQRHQYLITRALLRATLSRYCPPPPEKWRFLKNEHGRPEISPEMEMPDLRFNLSHTHGLISCGVVLREDIGVDVEETAQRKISLKIAEKHFSPKEMEDLCMLPPKEQKDRFFDYWTLKESYIKARGMGLSLPLDQFSFHISPNQPLSIFFDLRLRDNPQDWQFWLLKPTPQHKATVAVRCQREMKHSLLIRKTVPLSNTQPMACTILGQS